MGNGSKAAHHRNPMFLKLGRSVRAHANANPDHRCWRCGLTLTERHRTHPHATWDAGHLVDGDLSAGLAAECSSPCNRGSGAVIGNRNRHGNALGL